MSDMQRRKATRRAFEEEVRCLREALGRNPVRQTQVQGLLKSVERSFDEMTTYDRRIQDQMELEMADDEVVDKEVMEYKKYQRMYDAVFAEVPEVQISHSDDQHSSVSGSSSRRGGCGYRLPKLEMKKFSGDPKDWLYFWSQFKQIDDNENIPNETKHHHLVQATLEGSPARKVVESFPPSSENYPKALEYLKERFGNKDVLVEVYIRNLLGIVLSEQKNERKSLSVLYDKLETQLRSLESLDITADRYGAMLFPLVESSVPQESLRIWERTRLSASQDVRKDMSFLKLEVEGEERVKLAQQFSTSCTTSDEEKQQKSFKKKTIPTTTDLFSTSGNGKKRRCIFCDKMHPESASNCPEAKKMSLRDRKRILAEKGACFRCLQKGHIVPDCSSRKLCSVCDRTHDVSLCPENSEKKKIESEQLCDDKTDKTLWNQSREGGILLQTLLVRIVHNGEARRVRALIDTGSMRSYISKKAVDVLGFPKVDQTSLSHGLFGRMETKETRHNIHDVMITDLNGDNPISINMLDQEKICGSVSSIPTGSWLDEFKTKNIHLSDLGTDGYEIHLLLGADVAGDLITGEKWKSSAGPVAMKTILGWTVMGRLEKAATKVVEPSILNLLNVNSDMDALWNLEALGIRDPIEVESQEEKNKQAVEKFNRNVTVNDEGRYEVSLPWIAGHPTVADNLDVAKKRLLNATKKLEKVDKVQHYDNVLREWEELGIIEEVQMEKGEVSYLPHRAVFNPNSTTTPLRPVFDASCRSKGKPALNDCLEKGDNLIELVPAIIARFRLRRIGIISDIKKAFLQISVKIEDRRFLRFLWWEGIPEDKQSRKLKVYQHCRVVFGVNSSPFLLAATLNYHLQMQEEGKQPLAMELMRSMYVDNSCLAKDDEHEADKFRDDAISMMAEGKFDLCGWVRNGIDVTNLEKKIVSVLGLQWNVEEDTLQIKMDNLEEIQIGPVTKRKILSAAHRIFDPVGFTAPVALLPKLLLQKLWKLKLGWDEEVLPEIVSQFQSWMKEVSLLEAVKIPRWISFRKLEECALSLHLFTDASKDASAACVYLKSDDGSQVSVQMIMAKSRVCPKNGTIPRLELLGCLIGARLLDNVRKYLDFQEVKCFMWTDSANALYWIQNEDNWNPYIHNRVKEINQLTIKNDWRHVSGSLNPADLPSRGCSAKQLLKSRWWEGPSWLYKPEVDWPISEINLELEVVMAEKRKATTTMLMSEPDQWYLKKFSSFMEIRRLFGWILRWKNKSRSKKSATLYLRSEELQRAELVMWRVLQKECYSDSRQVLKQLDTVLDEDELRRVKTKLFNRVDSIDFRFPILLPHGHELVKIMIAHEHVRMGHMGVTSLICHLRERFWITKARITVKKVVSSCMMCKRVSCRRIIVEEGMLPEDRVRDALVFEVTGVDLGGPLHLKDGSKTWFVLYTCAVYRAIHLELVSSLSTDDFLMSLRRFMARRGPPAVIYSDNGRNFVGLSNKLKDLDWSKLENAEECQGILWKHIPPGSPWYGGFWERLVGVVKDLIRKNVGKGVLNYVELETVFCDVEYVVNSRPLTYVTEEALDPVIITPASFIHGVKSYGTPDLDSIDLVGANARRLEMMKELRGQFRTQYLSKLKNYEKPKKSDEVRVHDLVLVEKENVKKSFWPVGVIMELIPGRGGVIRKARVQLADGVKEFTLQRLFSMEVNLGEKREIEDQEAVGMKMRSGNKKL